MGRPRKEFNPGDSSGMSLKILFFTDSHIRSIRPVSRLDEDYIGTIFSEIDQVREISNDFDLVLFGGDLFDRPDVAHSVVIRAIKAFAKFKTAPHVLVGNHCVSGYSGSTVDSSAIGVLFESGVIKKLDSLTMNGVSIYGLHAYDKTVWTVPDGPGIKVLAAHKMITDRPFPGGACHLIEDVAKLTNADLILSGDIHHSHKVMANGKLFINPGALARQSIADRDRVPQVAAVTIGDDGTISSETIVLDHKPSSLTFDLENYSERMASEEHTRGFVKAYAQGVIDVSAKSQTVHFAARLSEYLVKTGATQKMCSNINEYRDRAELEVLAEIRD